MHLKLWQIAWVLKARTSKFWILIIIVEVFLNTEKLFYNLFKTPINSTHRWFWCGISYNLTFMEIYWLLPLVWVIWVNVSPKFKNIFSFSSVTLQVNKLRKVLYFKWIVLEQNTHTNKSNTKIKNPNEWGFEKQGFHCRGKKFSTIRRIYFLRSRILFKLSSLHNHKVYSDNKIWDKGI